jgi:hypothetical protein
LAIINNKSNIEMVRTLLRDVGQRFASDRSPSLPNGGLEERTQAAAKLFGELGG